MTSQVLPPNVPSKSRAYLLRLAARMAEEAELIGRRMAERRIELGLTQREVAERMPGSTQGSDVSRWARGKHSPEPMPQIAEALATTIADLVSGPLAERAAKEQDAPDLLDKLSEKTSNGQLSALRGEVAQLGDQIAALETTLLAELGQLRSVQEDQQKRQGREKRSSEETGT